MNTEQIKKEAFPLASLILLFAGLALVPFLFVVLVGGASGAGLRFVVLGQFILAVGVGIVPMYVVARGIQLSEE